MHIDVDYANQSEPERKAALDWTQWLGFKRARTLAKVATSSESLHKRWTRFAFYSSFAGVTGFPVIAAFARLNRITVAQLRALANETE